MNLFVFVDVVKFLIENGCHLTVRNLTGATPLHYSVAEGHMKISELLLQNGACSNALVTTNEVFHLTYYLSYPVIFTRLVVKSQWDLIQ